MNKIEIWGDIPGYEGYYQVSDKGNIKSLKRKVIKKNGIEVKINERILKSYDNSNGYLFVSLSKEGKTSNKYIHKLVAIVFLGHIPNGMVDVVDHIDGDKNNNNLTNLQVITTEGNILKGKKIKEAKGCYWNNRNKKWYTLITIDVKQINLGSFTEKYDAREMWELAHQNRDYYRMLLTTNDRKVTNKLFKEYLKSLK